MLGTSDVDSFLLLGDQSRLTLKEIKDERRAFDLSRVDLLTLSACETGASRKGADGKDVQSLSEIARTHGARSVVASLWSISDESTAVFMQRFYGIREKDGLTREEALARTQREFIEGKMTDEAGARNSRSESMNNFPNSSNGILVAFKHPFHWAPYVLLGNWR